MAAGAAAVAECEQHVSDGPGEPGEKDVTTCSFRGWPAILRTMVFCDPFFARLLSNQSMHENLSSTNLFLLPCRDIS